MSYLGNSPVPDESVFEVLLDTKADVVHEHVIADVTGLQNALDAKASSSHSHDISNVSGLQAVLDGKVTNTDVVNKLQEFGVGSSAKLITDWNSVVGSGWYMANEFALNAPIANWCIGTVIVHNSEWQVQEVTAFSSNDESGDTGTWRREKNMNVWSAWHRVYKTGGEIATVISALNTYVTIGDTQTVTGGKYFAGGITGPTPASNDSSANLATTAYVKRIRTVGLAFSAYQNGDNGTGNFALGVGLSTTSLDILTWVDSTFTDVTPLNSTLIGVGGFNAFQTTSYGGINDPDGSCLCHVLVTIFDNVGTPNYLVSRSTNSHIFRSRGSFVLVPFNAVVPAGTKRIKIEVFGQSLPGYGYALSADNLTVNAELIYYRA